MWNYCVGHRACSHRSGNWQNSAVVRPHGLGLTISLDSYRLFHSALIASKQFSIWFPRNVDDILVAGLWFERPYAGGWTERTLSLDRTVGTAGGGPLNILNSWAGKLEQSLHSHRADSMRILCHLPVPELLSRHFCAQQCLLPFLLLYAICESRNTTQLTALNCLLQRQYRDHHLGQIIGN